MDLKRRFWVIVTDGGSQTSVFGPHFSKEQALRSKSAKKGMAKLVLGQSQDKSVIRRQALCARL